MSDGWHGMVIPSREQRAAALAEEVERERRAFEARTPDDFDWDKAQRDHERKERQRQAAPPPPAKVYRVFEHLDDLQQRLDRILPWTFICKFTRRNGRPWTATHRRVLSTIKIRARGPDDPRAQISVIEVARLARCSERSVQMATQELRAAGLIAFEEVQLDKTRSEINTYELVPELWSDRAGHRTLKAVADRQDSPAAEKSARRPSSQPESGRVTAFAPTPLGAINCAVQGEEMQASLHSGPDRADTRAGPPASGADGPTTERPGPGALAELCPDGLAWRLAGAFGRGRTRKRRANPP